MNLRRRLFQSIIAPFTENILKRRSLPYYRRLEEFQWLDPEAVRDWQWRQIRELAHHAVSTVPHYRRVFAGAGLDPERLGPSSFAQLPILTKDHLQRGFPYDVVSEAAPRRLKEFSTSGSTGKPLYLYRDPGRKPLDQATFRWLNTWAGLEVGERYVHAKRTVAVPPRLYPLWSLLTGGRLLPTPVVVEGDGPRLAAELNSWQPSALIGMPSVLSLLAAALRDSGAELHFEVKTIISGAETLTPAVEELLKEVFRAPVHSRYGANESGTWMAQSCPDRVGQGGFAGEDLHVNAYRFLLEVVDERGRPVPPGEVGRILVTDLGNYVMPYIRYDIGDWGALAPGACSCGRGLPLLSQLLGRISEYLVLPSGRRMPAMNFVGLMRAREHGLREYQFSQPDANHLIVSVVPVAEAYGSEEIARLRKGVEELLGEAGVTVTVEVAQRILPEPSGKRPVVKPVGLHASGGAGRS